MDAAKEDSNRITVLLHLYMNMPIEMREREFPCTTKAAKVAGVSRRTILNWIEIGEIEAIMIGNKFMVYFPSLLDYLQRKVDRQ